MDKKPIPPRLPHEELLQLKRWNTPTIYNGWEQLTRHDPAQAGVNPEVTTDFMPQMGPMVGWAVTVRIEPSQSSHKENGSRRSEAYRNYIADMPGPKIVVVQDLDKPATTGSFWGEVNANIHRALVCVGHAHVVPVDWGCEVEVFGRCVEPGQLIHADKHGFLAIPPGEEEGLLDAAVFMDQNECNTVIKAARGSSGSSRGELIAELNRAVTEFGEAARERFGAPGEFGD